MAPERRKLREGVSSKMGKDRRPDQGPTAGKAGLSSGLAIYWT